MNIEQLKENSLNESVTSADIAQTDEIISSIIEQKQLDSLAYQICDVQTIHGPTGAQFSLQYNDGKVILLRNNVQVEDDAVQNTGFTLETIQDIQSQYGKNAIDFIGKTFSAISSTEENKKLISKIQALAVGDDTITLSAPNNAETMVFEISQKVSEEVMAMNSKTYRTMDSFVILPIKGAASFLAVGSYFNDTNNASGLFVGKKGRTQYYVNPILGDDNVYIGLNGKLPGNSSLIFSPYQHTLITAQDPDTGNTNVFNVNRYAITENSLSTAGNEMLRKFSLV